MNIVIGNGMIGVALGYALGYQPEKAIVTTRKEIDLKKEDWDIPWLSKLWRNVAYICAGETSTERCEKYPEETKLVNVTNTIKLANRLIEKGVDVVWLSSERVFDGSIPFRKVTDKVCPTTEYGKQKAETEKTLLEMGCWVIRLSKVLGEDVPLFEGWAKDLTSRKVIHPYSNMSMSPLPCWLVCELIKKTADLDSGLYQFSGQKDLTYSQIAYHIGAYIGADMELIQPIEAPESHLNTTLENSKDFPGTEIPDVWTTIFNWETDNLGNLALDWGR